jgi:hypothetical protein
MVRGDVVEAIVRGTGEPDAVDFVVYSQTENTACWARVNAAEAREIAALLIRAAELLERRTAAAEKAAAAN